MDSATESIAELPQLSPSTSIEAPQSSAVPYATESKLELPNTAAVESESECLTFVKRRGKYRPAEQTRLKNSLLAGVGFLELANAGDFAANVWNEVPIPVYAIVLMAIGGVVALGFSTFAFRDAWLSWRNLIYLRHERRYLRKQKAYYGENEEIVPSVDSLLDVNFRETGTEVVDRIGMDMFMGFGAIIVGVGTFLAIDGSNVKAWMASNLLSGYIGNVPCALYGLGNLGWSAYVVRRANRHHAAGAKELEGSVVEEMLKRRTRTVEFHATMNGIVGTVAGVGSLVSATRWWGYVVLVPCVVSSIFLNYLFRHWIGYDRPFARLVSTMNTDSLVRELKFVASAQQLLKQDPSGALSNLVCDAESIISVLEFIIKNDLFEDFCLRLLKDPDLTSAFFVSANGTLDIDSRRILESDEQYLPRLLEIARECITKSGPRCFRYRELYLLETLGCYLCVSELGTTTEKATEQPLQVV